MKSENKKSRTKRAVVSIALFLLFIILPISGKMIPAMEGNPTAVQVWSIVHNAAGSLFVLVGVFHVVYNRKALKNYLTRR